MVLARVTAGVHVEVEADFVEHVSDKVIYAIIFLVCPEQDAAQHLSILAQVAEHVHDVDLPRNGSQP